VSVEFSAWDEQVDATTQVVAVRGEIDIFTAPEFKERVTGAIEAGREVVIVDLAATTFVDSSSLGVLISAHRRLGSRDGRLIIACAAPAVRNTFKITGLDAVLEIVKDREAALAARDAPAPTPGQAAA
jgi:anti-sigma B factor antagonist